MNETRINLEETYFMKKFREVMKNAVRFSFYI